MAYQVGYCSVDERIPVLIADGGVIYFDMVPDPHPFNHLFFTLYGQNLLMGLQIRGSVAHPYGEGEFVIAQSNIIKDASITAYSDRIDFSFTVTFPLLDQPAALFTAKPLMNSEIDYGRPNSKIYKDKFLIYDNYPYSFQWLSCNTVNASGQSIFVIQKFDPIVFYEDREYSLDVIPVGFDLPVTKIALSGMRNVDFYPPIPLDRMPFYTFLYGIGKYRLTFDITLSDGSIQRISSGMGNPIYLRPLSSVIDWVLEE